MANQNQTSFNLELNGYTVRFESAPAGGYIVNCFDMTEKQCLYRVQILDLAELFWSMDEIETRIEVHVHELAEMKGEHPPEVLDRAKVLAGYGIKGALGAAYAARPMKQN